MTNETTKPVVTQADEQLAWQIHDAINPIGCCEMTIDEIKLVIRMVRLASHSSPDEPVVSQDLVPVAWMYENDCGECVTLREPLRGHVLRGKIGWTETPLYTRPPAETVVAEQINVLLEPQLNLNSKLLHRVSELQAQLAAARNDAMEEAASLVDAQPDNGISYQRLWAIAGAICALKRGSHRA